MRLFDEQPVTIGVISSTRTVMPDFARSLMILQKPDNARIIWTDSVDVVGNCNSICRGSRGRWIWLMGDDHTFDPDILVRLMAHKVDVVVPLCMKRTPPYDPVVYSHQDDDGAYVGADLPQHGLVPIHAAGSAGMLIAPWVIDELEDPWFESHGGLNEDLSFCAKVREQFDIFCDVDLQIGHQCTNTVWPAWRDGAWHVDLQLAPRIVMPVNRLQKLPV